MAAQKKWDDANRALRTDVPPVVIAYDRNLVALRDAGSAWSMQQSP
jgi:hypothetical protein